MSRLNTMECATVYPGRGRWQPMSKSQNMALISATLSSVGAGLAGFSFGSTGLSCGLAGMLSADAARQFYKRVQVMIRWSSWR